MRRSGRQLLQCASQGVEISLIQVEELRRRCEELLHELGFHLHATRRQHDELDAAVVRHAATLGEAGLLETIDDPGGVGRIAFPLVGKRPHRPAVLRVEACERPRIVRGESAPTQASGARRRRTHQKIEHQLPDAAGGFGLRRIGHAPAYPAARSDSISSIVDYLIYLTLFKYCRTFARRKRPLMLRVVLIFLHVMGAIGVFAALAIEGAVLLQIRRAADGAQLRTALEPYALVPRVAMPSLGVTLLTGIYLTATVWGWHAAWIDVAFLGVITTAAIGATMTRSSMTRLTRSLSL